MAAVTMPDGAIVDMPDQLDPALGARLRAFHDSQAAPKTPAAAPATNPSVGGKETTEGPLGFANGLAELVGKGLGNVPMGAVHALTQLVTGHGTDTSKPPTFPLSPNAQSVGQGISDTLGQAAAPYQNPLVDAATNSDLAKNYIAPVLSKAAAVAPVAGAVAGVGGLIGDARAAAAANPLRQLGLRTGGTNTLTSMLAGAAGESGRSAVSTQNVNAATRVAGNQVGVPSDVPVNPTSLEAARAAPGSVLDRAAQDLPVGPLHPDAAADIAAAANRSGSITKGSPNAAAQIADMQSRLLDPTANFTGQQIRSEGNLLRADGNKGISSADPAVRQVAQFQREAAAALDKHIELTLPENSAATPEQVRLARQTLAQNYTVGDLMKGPFMDLKGLGKLHQDSPNLLSGDLRTLGQFAVDHPEVSGLPSDAERFAPPGLASGIGKAIGPEGGDIGSRASNLFGIPASATRLLTGRPATAVAAAASRPVTGLGGEFEPIAPRQPAPLELQPAPGQAFEPHQPQAATGNPQRDFFGTGADNFTASPPSAPAPATSGPPGQIPLADLLSHGVEQPPAAGLSAGPMGAPPQVGLPFARNAGHEAGGLELTDMSLPPEQRALNRERAASLRDRQEGISPQFTPEPVPLNAAMREGEQARRTNSDLGAVMSQGVPEGTVAKTGPTPAPHPAEGGGLVFKSPNGQTIVRKRGDTLQVSASATKQTSQGRGEGTQRMVDAYNFAQAHGLRLVSDTKVSDAAAKIYDRLEKMGFDITRNPVESDGAGNLLSTAGRPAFEVTGGPLHASFGPAQ